MSTLPNTMTGDEVIALAQKLAAGEVKSERPIVISHHFRTKSEYNTENEVFYSIERITGSCRIMQDPLAGRDVYKDSKTGEVLPITDELRKSVIYPEDYDKDKTTVFYMRVYIPVREDFEYCLKIFKATGLPVIILQRIGAGIEDVLSEEERADFTTITC